MVAGQRGLSVQVLQGSRPYLHGETLPSSQLVGGSRPGVSTKKSPAAEMVEKEAHGIFAAAASGRQNDPRIISYWTFQSIESIRMFFVLEYT